MKAIAAQNYARGVTDEAHGSWVIDSGASAYMCNDESFFRSLKHFAGGFITLADGKRTVWRCVRRQKRRSCSEDHGFGFNKAEGIQQQCMSHNA